MRTTIQGWVAAIMIATTPAASAATLSYVLGFTGLTSATVAISVPIPAIQGLASYTFSSSVALTDLSPPDGVEANVFDLQEFFALGTGDSVLNPVFFDDVGGSATLSGPGPFTFSASGTVDCSVFAGGCSILAVALSFTLTPGDALVNVGTLTLNPLAVPEPATLALLVLAAAALAALRRFRLRTERAVRA